MYANRLISFSQRAFYRDKWSVLTAEIRTIDDPLQTGGSFIESKASPMTVARYSAPGESTVDGLPLVDWRDTPNEKGSLLYRNVF